MSQQNTIAFCLGDVDQIKHASLFYDSVFSAPLEAVAHLEEPQLTSMAASHDFFQVIPAPIYNEVSGLIGEVMADPHKFGWEGLEFANIFKIEMMMFHEQARRLVRGESLDSQGPSSASFKRLNEMGLQTVYVSSVDGFSAEGSSDDDFTASIRGLDLIDVSSASWEQILEVRRSEELRKKLRNLKLFFVAQYDGKSKTFVEDDLGKRIDDYHNVVSDLGFDTITSTISMLLGSKSLGAFGVGAITALYTGQPVVAATAASGGIAIEIGKISVKIAQKRHAFKKFNRDHDLAYLIDVKNRLPENSNV